MIMKTLDKVIVDMSDPAFPYILQHIAEDRLKKCILIVEFIFLWLS